MSATVILILYVSLFGLWLLWESLLSVLILVAPAFIH